MPNLDAFGNEIHPELPYARGEILSSVEADYREVRVARAHLRERIEDMGRAAVFNFTGLERGFPAETGDMEGMDDELAPALYGADLDARALEHLGGTPGTHDVFLANRMTAGTMSAFLTLVDPGETVIGVAPNRSHASVIRSADMAGANFVDATGPGELADAVETHADVSLVALSRMDVTYQHFPDAVVDEIVEIAHDAGAPVYMDDAAGGRVIPAIFGGPKSLETGVDVVSTGLDKYGVFGPRLGLMGGDEELVSRIRTRAWKLGLEARPVLTIPALRSLERYDPATVRELVQTTKTIGEALTTEVGPIVDETDVIVVLSGEDLLGTAMARADLEEPPIVPFEATAAVSMLLVRDYGAITVHFAGIPSGTSDFLVKFIPPATLNRFGGPEAFATAVNDAIETLAHLLTDPGGVRDLLLGFPTV